MRQMAEQGRSGGLPPRPMQPTEHARMHPSPPPLQIQHPLTKLVTRFWLEDPVLSKPIKEDAGPAMDNRLFPRECREAVSQPPWPAISAATGIARMDA